MTENERKILNLISLWGPLTKREIAEKCGLGWSTVVKKTARLQEMDLLLQVGHFDRKGVTGINSAIFGLNPKKPLALGIDLGYSETVLMVANLANDILYQTSIKTPDFSSMEDLSRFIQDAVENQMANAEFGCELVGAGVAVPSFIIQTGENLITGLQDMLSSRLDIPVEVDSNVRSYTRYFGRSSFRGDNFLVMTIRSGVGLGIMTEGNVYSGTTSLAGEISHVPLPGLTGRCRCGQVGCLETGVNISILEKDYRETVSGSDSAGGAADFLREAKGGGKALERLKQRADYLAQALVPVLLILDIPKVYLLGDFHDEGYILAQLVNRSLEDTLARRVGHEVLYESLVNTGFPLGACHLIFRNYY